MTARHAVLVLLLAAAASAQVSFEADIAPIFSKNGCNASACHGALNGQNGFRLSVFGYDPAADFKAIVEDAKARRVDLKNPEQSLILLKPTFQVTHGGGPRFTKESKEYQAILAWLKAGAPKGEPAPKLVELKVSPNDEIFFTAPEQAEQITVIGRYADGRERDLTAEVNYKANDEEVVSVSAGGRVAPKRSGETAIMVRSMGAVNVVRVAVSLRPTVAAYRKPPSRNFIDDFIFEKAARLRIVPSRLAGDAGFLRRVYLDLIGTLPRPVEVRRFLADPSPDKRSRVIDELFERHEYADFWSLKWGDQLTNSPQFLFNGTGYFQTWLRKALADNMPYDQFARALLTSSGTRYEANPSNYYGTFKPPLELASATAQTFMGVSLECARCHDHPSEKWKRADFNGLAAFFGQVKRKAGQRGNENMVYVDTSAEFKHPETKEIIQPKFPGEDRPVEFEPDEDRRERLAAWLTSPTNPYFAPAIVNRVWKQLFGRGLVEPEDFRVTNPPSYPELLAKLSSDFIEHGYDLRHLMRRILNSRAYQLSARVNETNRDDKTGFSHHYSRRLTAEQLADAVSQVTGVPERYPAFAPGKRAIQLPDDLVESYFLTTFDRPARETASCARRAAPNLTQSLHLINGEPMNARLRSDRGTLARLIEAGKTDRAIVEEFTLAAVSRMPTVKEYALAGEGIRRAGSRRAGLEDYAWALLNSKEFLYNH